jgi:hypothetical protein
MFLSAVHGTFDKVAYRWLWEKEAWPYEKSEWIARRVGIRRSVFCGVRLFAKQQKWLPPAPLSSQRAGICIKRLWDREQVESDNQHST